MGILLVISSATCLGVYEVLKKVCLKKSSLYEVLFFYCFCGFLVALAYTNVNVFNLTVNDFLLILLKSCIIVINWALLLKCVKNLGVSIVTPFSLLKSVFVVLGGVFIYHEAFTYVHVISFFFIGIGITLLSFLIIEDKEKKKNNYVYLGLLTLSCMLGAFTGLLDKYVVNYRHLDTSVFLTWFLFLNAIIYGIIYVSKNRKIEWEKLKTNYWLIFTGVMIALSDILYYNSLNLNTDISLVAILRRLSVIIATILASIFLHEGKLLKKLGILVIMLVGVILPSVLLR